MDIHAAAPWSVKKDGGEIRISDGDTVALMVFGPQPEETEDNARRIVACVNACKAVTTEAIESGTMDLFDLQLQRMILTQRCDELLSALELVVDSNQLADDDRVIDVARAAIERARNGAPVEVIKLSPKEFDRFQEQLGEKPLSKNKAVKVLLDRPKPWEDQRGRS